MPETSTYEYELDGEAVVTNDAVLSGRDIRTKGGLNPASEYILIEIGDVTSRSIGLEETIDLEKAPSLVLRSFQGDRTFSLTINERGFEWGADEISAADIRQYGEIPEGHELLLDSDHDRPIQDAGTVKLRRKGVERILSRPARQICIVINAREVKVDPGLLSFWGVVKLAFPNAEPGPNTAYTVSYRKGAGDHPEGTLIAGESVKTKQGMVFNVSETDKS